MMSGQKWALNKFNFYDDEKDDLKFPFRKTIITVTLLRNIRTFLFSKISKLS
jgi:hypothetical protein